MEKGSNVVDEVGVGSTVNSIW